LSIFERSINLAADYCVSDAIPLLEKEAGNHTAPKGGENHGYADTIGKRAKIALKHLET